MPGRVKWRSKARPGAREVKGGAVWRSVCGLGLALGLVGDGRHGETPSNLMKIYNFWLTTFSESGPDF